MLLVDNHSSKDLVLQTALYHIKIKHYSMTSGEPIGSFNVIQVSLCEWDHTKELQNRTK